MKKSTYIASKTASNFYKTNRSEGLNIERARQIHTSNLKRNSLNQLEINPESLAIGDIDSLPTTHNRSKSNHFILGEK
jgi:hypothetical protein